MKSGSGENGSNNTLIHMKHTLPNAHTTRTRNNKLFFAMVCISKHTSFDILHTRIKTENQMKYEKTNAILTH